jgi:hypothetical protein
MSNGTAVLGLLVLGGLMGMVGQGVRAIAGLKKMNDDAQSSGASSADLFVASRLIVSLLIGFIAGIIAALSLGLDKLMQIDANNFQLLLGIAAAGYSGTDLIESFAPTIIGRIRGATAPRAQAPGAARTVPEAAGAGRSGADASAQPFTGVVFGALVPGGFFSSDPGDLSVPRSIRTNNPGAMNISSWQRVRKGYVGVTPPDNSPDKNVTTIYRTPEHGVAAWYHLLSQIYGFGAMSTFTVTDLAQKYAGSSSGAAIAAYTSGWMRWSNFALNPATAISINDNSQMLVLARALFSHEAGRHTPVHDAQIVFAIQNERDGTLPS